MDRNKKSVHGLGENNWQSQLKEACLQRVCRALSAEETVWSLSRPQLKKTDMGLLISMRKDASCHLAPGEMQMKATMMANFTPVRMGPLECMHICTLAAWKAERGWPFCRTTQQLLIKFHVASPRWLRDLRYLSKRMERYPTKTCKWIFIHLYPE